MGLSDAGSVTDNAGCLLHIDSDSCSLCCYHRGGSYGQGCAECPLFHAGMGLACYEDTLETRSPWGVWMRNRDPEPMIALLEKALNESKP